jgi:hypothetical protein
VAAPREPPSFNTLRHRHPRRAHPVAALHVPLQRLRCRLVRAAPHGGLRRRPAPRTHRGGAPRGGGTRGRVRLLQRCPRCKLGRRCGRRRRLRRRCSLPAFGLRRDRALRRRLRGSLRRAVRCLLRPTRRRPVRVGYTRHRRERHLILEIPHLGVHLKLLGPRHQPVELVVDPVRARRHQPKDQRSSAQRRSAPRGEFRASAKKQVVPNQDYTTTSRRTHRSDRAPAKCAVVHADLVEAPIGWHERIRNLTYVAGGYQPLHDACMSMFVAERHRDSPVPDQNSERRFTNENAHIGLSRKGMSIADEPSVT